MKPLFFVALLILSSGPAYGECVAVGTTVDDETIYIDIKTIYREADLVDISVISDFQPNTSRTGHATVLHDYYINTIASKSAFDWWRSPCSLAIWERA
jgi:hypothetical protein